MSLIFDIMLSQNRVAASLRIIMSTCVRVIHSLNKSRLSYNEAIKSSDSASKACSNLHLCNSNIDLPVPHYSGWRK